MLLASQGDLSGCQPKARVAPLFMVYMPLQRALTPDQYLLFAFCSVKSEPPKPLPSAWTTHGPPPCRSSSRFALTQSPHLQAERARGIDQLDELKR